MRAVTARLLGDARLVLPAFWGLVAYECTQASGFPAMPTKAVRHCTHSLSVCIQTTMPSFVYACVFNSTALQ